MTYPHVVNSLFLALGSLELLQLVAVDLGLPWVEALPSTAPSAHRALPLTPLTSPTCYGVS